MPSTPLALTDPLEFWTDRSALMSEASTEPNELVMVEIPPASHLYCTIGVGDGGALCCPLHGYLAEPIAHVRSPGYIGDHYSAITVGNRHIPIVPLHIDRAERVSEVAAVPFHGSG